MKRENFFIVQNQIFGQKLTPTEFIVYCYLCRCNNRTNGCFPSKRTIANACGIAVSSVSKTIKQLDERGLVTRRANFSGGRQINNSYTLNEMSPMRPVSSE